MRLLSLVIYAASGAIVLGLIRNEFVYRVRVAILDLLPVSDALRLYSAIPPYGEMLYHPRYWLLWTKEHWLDWLARSGAEPGRSTL